MGMQLIFCSLRVVTDAVYRIPLLDWGCGEGVPGNSPRIIDRTLNRHRWTGRVYQGA